MCNVEENLLFSTLIPGSVFNDYVVFYGDSPLFVALSFRNGLQHCISDFERFIYNDHVISCEHFMKYGPVTPECKGVISVSSSSVSNLATFALLLDPAGSVLSYSGAISI